MADFEVHMEITEPQEPPDEKAVGSWACSCGAIKVGPVRASFGCTMHPRCVYCGDSAELLPLPLDETA